MFRFLLSTLNLILVNREKVGNDAPAEIALNPADTTDDPFLAHHMKTECVLGVIPHMIRGQLSKFQQTIPTGEAFHQCTACSPKTTSLLVLNKHGRRVLTYCLNFDVCQFRHFCNPSGFLQQFLDDVGGNRCFHFGSQTIIADEQWSFSDHSTQPLFSNPSLQFRGRFPHNFYDFTAVNTENLFNQT
ncbi:unnamed protein product [Cyprideis torosa]|uniref:Uncharacterized protein n=1 Tax=Cyprideis torosa TaxID=163714 RepID=A0A7R8W9V6_9CRUS|nr:unnamed protein product [Cyprideis torosa]CAG0890268.1 unnamed protein product [Cyprideis torosa]